MGVREAHDRTIALMVAGRTVPLGVVRVRAQLDHTERPRRTRESVTVAVRSDEDVDVTQDTIRSGAAAGGWRVQAFVHAAGQCGEGTELTDGRNSGHALQK